MKVKLEFGFARPTGLCWPCDKVSDYDSLADSAAVNFVMRPLYTAIDRKDPARRGGTTTAFNQGDFRS